MAIRKCPRCLAVVPAGEAAAYSDTLVCPGCQSPLEVAGISRHVAIWPAMAVGAFVWTLTSDSSGSLGWAAPVLYSFLAFGATAGLLTMFLADLRGREAGSDAPVNAGSHGGGHGGARGHH
jgi:hypothetical protein